MALSQRRQRALQADRAIVEQLYVGACERFGAEAVATDVSLLWTWRCMQGVQGAVPFKDGCEAKTLKELLYVAREVCGLPRREEA